jgi:integral membrane sensor domain MASE1
MLPLACTGSMTHQCVNSASAWLCLALMLLLLRHEYKTAHHRLRKRLRDLEVSLYTHTMLSITIVSYTAVCMLSLVTRASFPTCSDASSSMLHILFAETELCSDLVAVIDE